MTKPIIRIHDVSTNEIIDREMTNDEFVAHEASLAAIAVENEAIQAKEADKQALLDRLGITADEAKLLLS